MNRVRYPVALTIAGSDSGGGAGIQADLKTFHRFGVFGTSVVTAVTAQSTKGVFDVHTVPLKTVRNQIDAVVTDLRPQATKSGMLATADLVVTVAEAIDTHALLPYVMDPVMVASSGDRLLEAEAERTLKEVLLPLSSVVTPNLEEAGILTGAPVRNLEEMRAAAHVLVELGAGAALVKGGHLDGDAVDLLWDGETESIYRHPRIETPHTHGTGCTLSAAITAGLAAGGDLDASVGRAISFVSHAIGSAPGLGQGRGPVNHFAPID